MSHNYLTWSLLHFSLEGVSSLFLFFLEHNISHLLFSLELKSAVNFLYCVMILYN